MNMGIPDPPAEAVLIRLVRQASGKTAGETARAGGLSKSRLAQIEAGHQGLSSGYRPTSVPDGPLARIAAFLDITPEELDDAGRHGAAEVLRMIRRRPARAEQDADPRPAEFRDLISVDQWEADEKIRGLWDLTTISPDGRRGVLKQYLKARANEQADAEVTELRRRSAR